DGPVQVHVAGPDLRAGHTLERATDEHVDLRQRVRAAELHLRLQLLVLMAKAGAGQGSLRQLSLWHHRKNTAVVGGLPAHTDAARQLRARTQPHTAGDVDAVPVLNLIRAD